MLCSKSTVDFIILLSLPFQFSFNLNYYYIAESAIHADFGVNTADPPYVMVVCNKITNYVSFCLSIIFIFCFYQLNTLKRMISLTYFMSGITWLFIFGISYDRVWLLIIFRIFNGIYLAVFHGIHISYMYHFVSDDYISFFGCYVQGSMFSSLVIVCALFLVMDYKIVAVVVSVQSFVFGGLMWLVEDFHVPHKSITGDYIWNKRNGFNLMVMVMIMFFNQFSGIGVMIDNVAQLLSAIGINFEANLQSVITNSIGLLSTIIGSFVIDILGIRTMWCFSAFGACLGLIIYWVSDTYETPKWLGTLGVFCYFLFYGLGEGPIPWFLCGALFPESVRIESGSINMFCNRFMDVCLSYIKQFISDEFGEIGTIIMSLIFNVIAIVFGYFCLHDIRKTEVEEVNIF